MMPYDMTLNSIHEATDRLKKTLEKRGFTILRIIPKNHNRHMLFIVKQEAKNIFAGRIELRKLKYYLVYQRQYLQQFPKIYNVEEEIFNDVAVGINLSLLKYLVKTKVNYVVFASQDGKLFYINPKAMLKIIEEKKWYRSTKKTGEYVANLPITILKELH